MSEKRYVVLQERSGMIVDLDTARLALTPKHTIYELGPEVKEPDYGPLVAYIRAWKARFHHVDCHYYRSPVHDCDCEFGDALKAAGIE